MDINFVDSTPIRLFIHSMTLFVSLMVTQMVRIEFIRTQDQTFKYLAISFKILFIQTLFLLIVFIYSIYTGSPLPELFMPIIDHGLGLLIAIYLCGAFIFSKAGPESAKKFTNINLIALVLSFGTIWFFWAKTLAIDPSVKFGFFWGDTFLETWRLGLIITSLIFINKTNLLMKKWFKIALLFLVILDSAHLLNIIIADNTIPLLVLIERSFSVLFSYFVFKAIYTEITSEIIAVSEKRRILDKHLYENSIKALVKSLEAKDEYTKGHSERVTRYALAIAKQLEVPDLDLELIYYSTILHDIGKIGISDNILTKKGKLTAEEFEIIKKHPIIGANIAESAENLASTVPVILYHHERFDGKGYPQGLKGNDIPLAARIVTVADSYDAMTSDRPYKAIMSPSDAVAELIRCKGTQFCPVIVDAMIEVLKNEDILGEKINEVVA